MSKKYDLTIIIPGKNEEFMGKTIEDLLENIEGNTEIIAVLDGYQPDPPLTQKDLRLTIIYNPESVGQRAATNQAARLSKSKYLMKVDAHCAFDKGFDVKMMNDMQDDWTMVPTMRNLHAFNWVCENGHERYQGPSGPCQFPKNPKGDGEECKKSTKKVMCWIPKTNPSSVSYSFDKTMHFQYFGQYKHTEEYTQGVEVGKDSDGNPIYDKELNESMSIQGSCFMCTRDKYFELDLCSEDFSSWGQQGVEVACKTWLSGGKVVINRKTWYAHMFRTQGGDFGFPYHNPQSKVVENREKSRQLFQKDNWPLAKHKFQWLLDKFDPPDWVETKGMIYYTDNELDEKYAKPCRDAIVKIGKDKKINITTAALKRRLDFGLSNVYFPTLKRGYLAMFKQVLAALEKSTDDIIFFTEHDVLYHESHFDFIPPDENTFYYNRNVWFLRSTDGHALHYDVNQLSGLCVYRDAALTHYRERFAMAEEEWNKIEKAESDKDRQQTLFGRFIRNMGFEPFTHNRIPWKNQFKKEHRMSELPNVDIKHGGNATGQRWNKDQYRNKKLLINWTESDNWNIPGWTKDELKILQ